MKIYTIIINESKLDTIEGSASRSYKSYEEALNYFNTIPKNQNPIMLLTNDNLKVEKNERM